MLDIMLGAFESPSDGAEDWANFESFSIKEMKMFLMSTSTLRLEVVSKSCSRV